MLGEAFDVSRQAKKCRQRFACFSSHGFLAVCEIHSNWAVLLVILNEVEVCPLFAALRVFCHAQHIRNKKVELHLKDCCPENARSANMLRCACCVCVAHDKTHATL